MAFPKKISELPIAPAIKNTDLFVLVHDGVTSQITKDRLIFSADTNTFVTGGTITGTDLILGRNNGGNVPDIDLSSLSATTFSWSNSVVKGGNTSGDCITQLWVTTISGCSPVVLGPEVIVNGEIKVGDTIISSSGITISGKSTTLQDVMDNGTVATGLSSIININTSNNVVLESTGGIIDLTANDNITLLSHNGTMAIFADDAQIVPQGELMVRCNSNQGIIAGNVLASKDTQGNLEWITPSIEFTGNTSGTSIDELWVTNIEGSSPVTIGSSIQSPTSTTSGLHSISYGDNNIVSGDYAIAFGTTTSATTKGAHAEGSGTWAKGDASHAEGGGTIAEGTNSHAEGDATKALNTSAHAEGHKTIASGLYSHAEGNNTLASGESSHAEGNLTIASGDISHTEGYASQALNFYTHAEGKSTIASGSSAHAEGRSTEAYGEGSHSEGGYTKASGNFSHAGGLGRSGNSVLSSGVASFAHFYNQTGPAQGALGEASAILGGKNHVINTGATSSAIIGGATNIINDDVLRSVIIGGGNITGSADDTVYVPNLNIGTIGGGTPISNLGIDASGFVVTGTDSGDTNTFVTGGTLTNTDLTLKRSDGSDTSPIDLSGLKFSVTGGTLTNTDLTLKRSDGSDTSPIDLSGLKFSGGSDNCINTLYVNTITGCTGEDLHIGVDNGQDFYIDSTGTTTHPSLYINSLGEIGAGTNTPEEALHVLGESHTGVKIESKDGNAFLTLDSDAEQNTYIDYKENTNRKWRVGSHGSSDDDFRWATGNTFNNSVMTLSRAGTLTLPNLLHCDDDTDAGVSGLTVGNLYQTSGLGAAPLDKIGIVMIKQ